MKNLLSILCALFVLGLVALPATAAEGALEETPEATERAFADETASDETASDETASDETASETTIDEGLPTLAFGGQAEGQFLTSCTDLCEQQYSICIANCGNFPSYSCTRPCDVQAIDCYRNCG